MTRNETEKQVKYWLFFSFELTRTIRWKSRQKKRSIRRIFIDENKSEENDWRLRRDNSTKLCWLAIGIVWPRVNFNVFRHVEKIFERKISKRKTWKLFSHDYADSDKNNKKLFEWEYETIHVRSIDDERTFFFDFLPRLTFDEHLSRNCWSKHVKTIDFFTTSGSSKNKW